MGDVHLISQVPQCRGDKHGVWMSPHLGTTSLFCIWGCRGKKQRNTYPFLKTKKKKVRFLGTCEWKEGQSHSLILRSNDACTVLTVAGNWSTQLAYTGSFVLMQHYEVGAVMITPIWGTISRSTEPSVALPRPRKCPLSACFCLSLSGLSLDSPTNSSFVP